MPEDPPVNAAAAAANTGAPSPGPNRRAFLRRGLLGGLILGAGGVFAYQQSGYQLAEDIAAELVVLSPKGFLVLQAAADRLLAADGPGAPSPRELDVALWIDAYLGRQPSWLQRDVELLLNTLEHAGPIFDLTFSRFTRQSAAQQDRTLRAWAKSRLEVRRQGFSALKGLCVLAYYRHEKSWPLIGYDGPLVARGG